MSSTPSTSPSSSSSSSPSSRRSTLDVHYSSKTEEWSTPPDLFRELDDDFDFKLDAAASHENAKCDRYFTKEDDALKQSWGPGPVWLNTPYGRQIAAFMEKAYEESKKGTTVVCLVPARTDTKWWHKFAAKGTVIHLPGRLKFGNAKFSAPFPSAIVIFFGGPLGHAVRPH